jgi:arylsulfatase A
MKKLLYSLSSLIALTTAQNADAKPQIPNIVIIYADDMGYGDLSCQNPDSKIPTPNLDKLASEGMRFTDAHSSSGISSPSRFGLLTGMYHWRRQHGIVNSFGKPFFKDSDITLPQVLKSNGYTTACIGKWHLGWDWEFKNEPSGETEQLGKNVKYYQPEDIDWCKPVKGGPLARGFDYYFGDGTINFPPYTWIENDSILEIPTESMLESTIGFETKEGRWEFRAGPKVKDWNPYKVLPTLTTKTVEWIKNRKENEPFFLYLALPSPHAPIIPNDEFDNSSKAGAYGDFVVQTDWVAGQVLQALKEKGLDKNTIVIFSADNGTEHYAWKRAEIYGHFSMGNDRGLKQDVYEGGHHVPFIVKWPGKTKAGSVSDEVISQVDLMATLAGIAGIKLPENAAVDSYDITPILKGKQHRKPFREATVHNTWADKWAIRKGDWLFINSSTGSTRKMPDSFVKLRGYVDFNTPGLLFNMKEDSEQRVNLYDKYPEKVKELEQLLKEYTTSNRTVFVSGF